VWNLTNDQGCAPDQHCYHIHPEQDVLGCCKCYRVLTFEEWAQGFPYGFTGRAQFSYGD
jgi:hypothetical protein